jgi:prepilin signal peptidase PulO-like enzyme (type II secretory pathway)
LIGSIVGVVLGLVWRAARRGKVFPFGPALAVGTVAALLLT